MLGETTKAGKQLRTHILTPLMNLHFLMWDKQQASTHLAYPGPDRLSDTANAVYDMYHVTHAAAC